MASLVGKPVLVALALVVLTATPSLAAVENLGGVRIVYFEDYVIFDSDDLGVCGATYIVYATPDAYDLAKSGVVVDWREGRWSAFKAVNELEGLIKGVVEATVGEGRVLGLTLPAKGGAGVVPVILVSVPATSDVEEVAGRLNELVAAAEERFGVRVTVIVQVVPDELLLSSEEVDLDDLKAAVDTVASALSEAVSVALGRAEPSSDAIAELAEALKGLIDVERTSFAIERPEPEHGDPLYISIDLSPLATDEIDQDAAARLAEALREIVGCEYPIVIGFSKDEIVHLAIKRSPAPEPAGQEQPGDSDAGVVGDGYSYTPIALAAAAAIPALAVLARFGRAK